MTSRTARTHARLQAVALELITSQGFEATTVAQIARSAGVTPMTFFRHFATKEDVVLDDPYDPVIAKAVAAQPAHLPALERVRRAVVAAWSTLPEPDVASTRARVAITARTPALLARAHQNNQRTEQLVVDALVRTGTDPLEARVAAGACFGALMAALADWGTRADAGPLGARITTAMALLAPVGAPS